jgi:hypothetical protein
MRLLLAVIAAFGTSPVPKDRPTALLAGGKIDLFLGEMGSPSAHLRFGMMFDWGWHFT